MVRALADSSLFKAEEDPSRPKYYLLEMLPYPSGTLHVASFATTRSAMRSPGYKWMRGFNVLHPMGWGRLRIAGRERRHRKQSVTRAIGQRENIAYMKKQHKRYGLQL